MPINTDRSTDLLNRDRSGLQRVLKKQFRRSELGPWAEEGAEKVEILI
jgi:hypothetical protein